MLLVIVLAFSVCWCPRYNLKNSIQIPLLETLWLNLDREGLGHRDWLHSHFYLLSMLKVYAEHHEVDRAPGGGAQPSRVLLLPRSQDAAHHSHRAQPHDLQVAFIRKRT